jgi:Uma2 family endonuclease
VNQGIHMILNEQLVTAAEFFEIAALPENANKRLELEDGVIVEMASSSRQHTIAAGLIVYNSTSMWFHAAWGM